MTWAIQSVLSHGLVHVQSPEATTLSQNQLIAHVMILGLHKDLVETKARKTELYSKFIIDNIFLLLSPWNGSTCSTKSIPSAFLCQQNLQ